MYEQVIAINVGLAMLLAMSLNIITGFAGQPTLGHAAFYGIGAYTSALLTAKAGWPFLLALPASGRWRRWSECCSDCSVSGCVKIFWQ